MRMEQPAKWLHVIAVVAFAVLAVATGLVGAAEIVFANLTAVVVRAALNGTSQSPLLEGMSNSATCETPTDSESTERAPPADAAASGDELALDDLKLPQRESLVHFAYPSTIGGSEAGKADENVIKDYVKGHGEFKIVAEAPTQRWSGPESSAILANDAVSIFVTVSKLRSQDVDGSLSLFLLKANSASTVSSNTEKNVELKFEEGEDGALFIVGVYGDDQARVRLEDTTGSRTFWMTRGGKYLNVGFFDTHSESSGSERVDRLDTVKAMTFQPVQLNADGSTLEPVTSLVIYGADVHPELHAVKAGIQRHAMHRNELYARLFQDQKKLEEAMHLARVTPRFAGAEVAEACKEVEDWTLFDPAKVSMGCRNAIRDSCIADPSQAGCECWSKEGQAYTEPVCEAARLLYGTEQEQQQECAAKLVEPSCAVPEELAPTSFIPPPSLWTWLTPF